MSLFPGFFAGAGWFFAGNRIPGFGFSLSRFSVMAPNHGYHGRPSMIPGQGSEACHICPLNIHRSAPSSTSLQLNSELNRISASA
jgi:hypothetical protein